MDPITHILVGACVAQLPSSSQNNEINKSKKDDLSLTFKQRATIGGITAAFPDIDYILFLINPLDFLAYWHRAETHSVILAPLWALLLCKAWMLWRDFKPFQKTVFFICLLSLVSHTLLDSLTPYGTQWLAPFSDYRVSWDLIFVVDIYFTLFIGVVFLCMYLNQNTHRVLFIFLLPFIYLALIYQIKQTAIQNIQFTYSSEAEILVALPQPFSPFYWQIIRSNKTDINQTFYRLVDDPIAPLIASLTRRTAYLEQINPLTKLQWTSYSLQPKEPSLRVHALKAWHHADFKAYRDFSIFPVFYLHSKEIYKNCFWFSDLRYHWPGFRPVFRYGMCLSNDKTWAVHRMKYLSDEDIKLLPL